MTDQILKTITDPTGEHRVHIVLRPDGVYSYRLEFLVITDAGTVWGGHGPYCGLYDSAETAQSEAVLRVWWSNNELELTANTPIPEIDLS